MRQADSADVTHRPAANSLAGKAVICMNFDKAAKRHENQARALAHLKRSKLAAYHLRKAEILRTAKKLKRECK
jgi:hypothetical protein